MSYDFPLGIVLDFIWSGHDLKIMLIDLNHVVDMVPGRGESWSIRQIPYSISGMHFITWFE